MKLKYRLLKIVILVVLLGGLMVFATNRHNNKPIDKIDVNIADSQMGFINKENVKNMIDSFSISGKPIDKIEDIDIAKVKDSMVKNPYIGKANIYIDLDGKVVADIDQRKPIARVNAGKDSYYIDEEGKKMPLSTQFSLPVLLVSGKIQEGEWKEIASFSKILKENSLLSKHILELSKVGDKNYNLIVNQNNMYIEFGELADNKQKLTNLQEFYSQYLDKVGFGKYKAISLRYDNQIVATKK